MTALVVYDTASHDIARYVSKPQYPKGGREAITRTHVATVNPEFVGAYRSLLDFLWNAPDDCRVGVEPYNTAHGRQLALTEEEASESAHLGDV